MARLERISLEEALEQIAASLRPLGEEQVALDRLPGRTLSRDVYAALDQPPFDRSPLDGYALCSQDVQGASREHPALLQVTETVWAGQVPEKTVTSGKAARIMTGAPLPTGCDCVVRQEETDQGFPRVAVFQGAAHHENYVFRGEDYTAGTRLLRAGRRLDAAAIGLLASAGEEKAWVLRRPRIALLTTGDEVEEPGVRPLPPGKIYGANAHLLRARLWELGMDRVSLHKTGDEAEETACLLKRLAADCDCVISTGGVSVGERDVFHQALSLAGARQIFWRVRLKPGTPAIYSLLEDSPILSLSGNPFAAAATFELLGRPVLSALCPEPHLAMEKVWAVLDTPFPKKSSVRRFLRGIYAHGHLALPQGHSSGTLRSFLGCNCLAEVPEGSPALQPGSELAVYLL